MTSGQLIQVDPAGPTLTFTWNPTTVVYGGWQARLEGIDRPRRLSATEWVGREARTVSFTLRLDGYPNRSVSAEVLQLQSMAGMHAPNLPPPQLRLNYGGLSARRFVIAELSRGPEVRRDDLQVVRIDMDIVLREWISPDVVPSPAKRATERQAAAASGPTATAGKTWTVQSGDTLWAVASNLLGDGNRWRELADVNGIRDPRTIRPGQTLTVPDR